MNLVNPIRIAICDDHPVIRFGITSILNNEPDFKVVLEAASSNHLLQQFAKLTPDITILDLDLDGTSGIDCLNELRQINPTAKVVIYTAFDDNEHIKGAIEAGIQGYLLKHSDRSDILNCIRTVNKGETSIQASISSKLIALMQHEQTQAKAKLSHRESQVLQLLAIGKTNNDIANILFICERTVKFHVSSIFKKLHVRNRTEAALYVKQNNI